MGASMKKKWGIRILALLVIIIPILAWIAYQLVWNGIILLNHPSGKKYPIRGVDVSAYQGDIDWDILETQSISFAFIKATEGSTFVDKRFAENYRQAQKTGLRIGAYHFFSFDSEGKTQADNFIRTVPNIEGMLPPVIDVEYYGNKAKNPPAKAETREQLTILLNAVEAYYGKKPIIYATEESYDRYLANEYKEYDIWIRNVISKPKLSDERAWTFWQYTNRGRMDGYKGKEKFIDLNVYSGSKEEFENYFTSK